MKVGKYQIGRFHAIIRKEYADGSVDYETSFTDIEDFNESYYCILKCIGKEVGIATDNPKVLTYACVIRGKEEIEKEIEARRVLDSALKEQTQDREHEKTKVKGRGRTD